MSAFCPKNGHVPTVNQLCGGARKKYEIQLYRILENRRAIVKVNGEYLTTTRIVMIHISSGSEEWADDLGVYYPRWINLITRSGSLYWGSGGCIMDEHAKETMDIYDQMYSEGKVLCTC